MFFIKKNGLMFFDGVMIRKIKSDTGTPANENEEGVNEYFYSEFPPHDEMHLLN